ncbi:MAG: SUMF1/EgtB/PvdO family nonheme iron enzyme, partial [Odoribacter sp.]|nr:SUMF1/EgtB/PvdO family nonheme iron enzyme [Odoribacter sp.]
MKFIVVICLFLLSFSALGQSTVGNRNQVKKVAILGVRDVDNEVARGVKTLVRSRLVAAITSTPGYEGYERDLTSIMEEQKFQRTGMVSDSEIKKLGQMTGASYVLVADVAKINESEISITARIVEVESGKLENEEGVSSRITGEALEKACRQLATSLFNRVTGGRSSTLAGSMAVSGKDFIESAFGINMKMVYVKGGEFLMGGTSEQGSDADENERPIRWVTLDSYYIGAFEVTNKQWQKVMGRYDCSVMRADYPKDEVFWESAQAFCQELSSKTGKKYVLPTEAQWEYAARGGSKSEGTKYSGSRSVDVVACYEGNNDDYDMSPVGRKRPNELGLYDMSGNVWEWCQDWYGAYRT